MYYDNVIRDGLFRYRSDLTWDASLPKMYFVMLNPSGQIDEGRHPTTERCIQIAKYNDCGGIVLLNLFGICAKTADQLMYFINSDANVIGENEKYITDAWDNSDSQDIFVVAFGNMEYLPPKLMKYVNNIIKYLNQDQQLKCIGFNKTGHPTHPLGSKENILKQFIS
jgi:hypothetical protein